MTARPPVSITSTHEGRMKDMTLTILRPSLTGPTFEVDGEKILVTPKHGMSAAALVGFINKELKRLGLSARLTAQGATEHGNRAMRRAHRRPTR